MAEIGLYEAMRTTRAVRRLRPDPIPDAVLRRVIEAATWAPSGGNRQPWRIVVVRDPQKKQRLRELYTGPWQRYAQGQRRMLERLPADSRAKGERSLRAADHLAAHLDEAPALLVFCFNPELLAITDLSHRSSSHFAFCANAPTYKRAAGSQLARRSHVGGSAPQAGNGAPSTTAAVMSWPTRTLSATP